MTVTVHIARPRMQYTPMIGSSINRYDSSRWVRHGRDCAFAWTLCVISAVCAVGHSVCYLRQTAMVQRPQVVALVSVSLDLHPLAPHRLVDTRRTSATAVGVGVGDATVLASELTDALQACSWGCRWVEQNCWQQLEHVNGKKSERQGDGKHSSDNTEPMEEECVRNDSSRQARRKSR